MKYLSAALALLLLCAATMLNATTYYVSPSGNDSNNGQSMSSPFQTIGHINSLSLSAGDTVLFEGGATFTDDMIYLEGESGTSANPITFGSYGTGRATIKRNTDSAGIYLYNSGGILIENLNVEGNGRDVSSETGINAYVDTPGDVRFEPVVVRNCTISNFHQGISVGAWPWQDNSYSGFDGFTIENCLVHTIRHEGISTWGMYPGSSTQQSHRNILIRDTEVYGVTGDPNLDKGSGSGIIVSGTIGGLVDRCYAHNNGGLTARTTGGNGYGIWTWGADSVVIQHSLVHDQKTKVGLYDGGGFDIDGGATNCMIQYCYSYNNEGPGYLSAQFEDAPPMNNNTFRYNISYNDGRYQGRNMASGFHFWKGPGANPMNNHKIYNNLVYTDSAGGGIVAYQDGNMSGLEFYNNIFIVSGGERFIDIPNNTAKAYYTFKNNAYWAVDGNWNGGWKWGSTTYTSLTAWRGAGEAPETISGQPVGYDVDPRIANLSSITHPTSVDDLATSTAFQLLTDSPLINNGLDLTTSTYGSLDVGTQDYYGNSIPLGSGYDLGVHEQAGVVITVPTAPSGLSATAASDTQIDLSWTDNSGDEDGFKVQRSADGSTNWTQVATRSSNVTTYSDPNLTSGTTYYYRVLAYNGGGDSTASNTANATTTGTAPIMFEAEDLTRRSSSGSTANVTTDAAASGGERIQVTADGGQGQWVEFDITGLATGVYDLTYQYWTWDNRALTQATWDGTDAGAVYDQYGPRDGAAEFRTSTAVEVTVSSTNTQTVRFTATDKQASSTGYTMSFDYFTLTRTGDLPTLTELEQWRTSYFSSADLSDSTKESTVWGHTADPDGDGYNNLLEYALGTDPNDSASSANMTITDTGTDFQVSFNRARTSATYVVEKTADLTSTSWTTHATNPGNVGETVTVTVPQTEMTDGKLYLRLSITQ